MTWCGVIATDRIFTFGWTIPLSTHSLMVIHAYFSAVSVLSRSMSQRYEQKPDGRWKNRWRDLTNKEPDLLTSKRTEIRSSLTSTPGWRSTCTAFQLVLGSTAFWNPLKKSVTIWTSQAKQSKTLHMMPGASLQLTSRLPQWVSMNQTD